MKDSAQLKKNKNAAVSYAGLREKYLWPEKKKNMQNKVCAIRARLQEKLYKL